MLKINLGIDHYLPDGKVARLLFSNVAREFFEVNSFSRFSRLEK